MQKSRQKLRSYVILEIIFGAPQRAINAHYYKPVFDWRSLRPAIEGAEKAAADANRARKTAARIAAIVFDDWKLVSAAQVLNSDWSDWFSTRARFLTSAKCRQRILADLHNTVIPNALFEVLAHSDIEWPYTARRCYQDLTMIVREFSDVENCFFARFLCCLLARFLRLW